tara:strand:+ start:249 stop:473 length:225 start_codon:yes stop_codon:yes gene_type:complete
MADSISRSVAKSITWRIIASLTSGVIALAFGLPMKAAIGVVIVDMIVKFIMYIGHERLWANIPKIDLTIFKKKV